ncbi:MAG: hypothetical protein ACR2PF_21720 [Rhizobiaceae bacterium]
MTHEIRLTALKLGSITILVFGLLTFLSLVTPLSVVLELFLDIAVWPPMDGAYDTQTGSTRLLVAIVGGLSAGLGILLYMIADTIYRDDPKLGGRIMLAGIFGWFIVDSLGSALSSGGGWFNVILNLSFLALIALPILWPEHKSATQTA